MAKGVLAGNGIGNSGIFGMIGTTVQCNATDTSTYCMIAKLVSGIVMVIFLLFIIYLIYLAFNYFTGSKKTGGYVVLSKKFSRKRRSV